MAVLAHRPMAARLWSATRSKRTTGPPVQIGLDGGERAPCCRRVPGDRSLTAEKGVINLDATREYACSRSNMTCMSLWRISRRGVAPPRCA